MQQWDFSASFWLVHSCWSTFSPRAAAKELMCTPFTALRSNKIVSWYFYSHAFSIMSLCLSWEGLHHQIRLQLFQRYLHRYFTRYCWHIGYLEWPESESVLASSRTKTRVTKVLVWTILWAKYHQWDFLCLWYYLSCSSMHRLCSTLGIWKPRPIAQCSAPSSISRRQRT